MIYVKSSEVSDRDASRDPLDVLEFSIFSCIFLVEVWVRYWIIIYHLIEVFKTLRGGSLCDYFRVEVVCILIGRLVVCTLCVV